MPPGNLLWASDSPYGRPLASAVLHLRCALQAGLDAAAVRTIAGAQLERLLDGGEPLDAGPPPGTPRPFDLLLERTVSHLNQAVARSFDHGDPEEPVALWRGSPARSARTARTPTCTPPCSACSTATTTLLAPAPPGGRFPEAVPRPRRGDQHRPHARRPAAEARGRPAADARRRPSGSHAGDR